MEISLATRQRECNIPKKYKSFKPLHSENEIWKKYYLEIKAKLKNNENLVFAFGGHGTGKTQMATCLCTAVHIDEKTAHYTTMMEMIIEILDHQSRNETKKIVKYYCSKSFLVIDAFELRKGSEFEYRILNYIIDKRYMDQKNTMIISNETKSEIIKTIGSAIVSRAEETGSFYQFNWGSFRRGK